MKKKGVKWLFFGLKIKKKILHRQPNLFENANWRKKSTSVKARLKALFCWRVLLIAISFTDGIITAPTTALSLPRLIWWTTTTTARTWTMTGRTRTRTGARRKSPPPAHRPVTGTGTAARLPPAPYLQLNSLPTTSSPPVTGAATASRPNIFSIEHHILMQNPINRSISSTNHDLLVSSSTMPAAMQMQMQQMLMHQPLRPMLHRADSPQSLLSAGHHYLLHNRTGHRQHHPYLSQSGHPHGPHHRPPASPSESSRSTASSTSNGIDLSMNEDKQKGESRKKGDKEKVTSSTTAAATRKSMGDGKKNIFD